MKIGWWTGAFPVGQPFFLYPGCYKSPCSAIVPHSPGVDLADQPNIRSHAQVVITWDKPRALSSRVSCFSQSTSLAPDDLIIDHVIDLQQIKLRPGMISIHFYYAIISLDLSTNFWDWKAIPSLKLWIWVESNMCVLMQCFWTIMRIQNVAQNWVAVILRNHVEHTDCDSNIINCRLTIDYTCEDGHFPMFTSCVTISNHDSLPSSETRVNLGRSWKKKRSSEWAPRQKAHRCGILSTSKRRAETLHPAVSEFDHFKPRLQKLYLQMHLLAEHFVFFFSGEIIGYNYERESGPIKWQQFIPLLTRQLFFCLHVITSIDSSSIWLGIKKAVWIHFIWVGLGNGSTLHDFDQNRAKLTFFFKWKSCRVDFLFQLCTISWLFFQLCTILIWKVNFARFWFLKLNFTRFWSNSCKVDFF